MTESTLAVAYADLRRAIGLEMGWGRDPANWTSDQTDDCEYVLKTALRNVYYPMDERGRDFEHEWSFLRVKGQITTAANVADYALPDDFGDIRSNVFYRDSTQGWKQIPIVSPERVSALRQQQITVSSISWPLHYASIAPLPLNGVNMGQRWEMMFWPTPGGVYKLDYYYNIQPNAIDTTAKYPYGASNIGELLITACLRTACKRFNDANPNKYEEEYRQRLAAAISWDKRANRSHWIGYNGDNSDATGEVSDYQAARRYSTVTVNGVQY